MHAEENYLSDVYKMLEHSGMSTVSSSAQTLSVIVGDYASHFKMTSEMRRQYNLSIMV
jgi:hypothetical protein